MKYWTILLTILCLGVAGLFVCRQESFVSPFTVNSDPEKAAQLSVDDPVQSGRDAMDHWVSYPWYDSATDGLRRVDVPPPPTPSSFNFRWGTMLQWLAWTLLIVAIILIIYFATRSFFNRDIRSMAEASPKSDPSARDRIESLPFPIAVGNMNLLDEARRLYQQGEFSKAIIYLFSYQLVELDKRHRIRLTKGKTNRQYLREVGSRLSLRKLVEQTMIAFEDAFFGHHPLDQSRFESCWFQLGEFEKLNAEA